MSQFGEQDMSHGGQFSSATQADRAGAKHRAVFSGKPHMQEAQHLALQQSLMEVFDEFAEVVSDELKSLTVEEFKAEFGCPRQNLTE